MLWNMNMPTVGRSTLTNADRFRNNIRGSIISSVNHFGASVLMLLATVAPVALGICVVAMGVGAIKASVVRVAST